MWSARMRSMSSTTVSFQVTPSATSEMLAMRQPAPVKPSSVSRLTRRALACRPVKSRRLRAPEYASSMASGALAETSTWVGL